MKMNDLGPQNPIERYEKAARAAREVLSVSAGASRHELKRAWRRACMKHHPDRNPGDADAGHRLAVINCAYRLLACGEICDVPREKDKTPSAAPEHEKYNLDNAWGWFLWWKDRFF